MSRRVQVVVSFAGILPSRVQELAAMLDRVHFENFKSLENVTIDLERLTVLTGPNGSGKSSVLQALHLLSLTGVPRPEDGSNTWRRFGGIYTGALDPARLASHDLPANIKLAARRKDGEEVELAIRVEKPVGRAPNGDECEFAVMVRTPTGSGTGVTIPSDGLGRKDELIVLDSPAVRRLASTVYLHLDATVMGQPSVPEEERPRLSRNGDNLASTLTWMKGAAEESLDAVREALRRVVPGVRRIRTARGSVLRRRITRIDVDGQPVWRPVDETVLADQFEIEFDDGRRIPADLLSEGTLLALGLLTKLHEPERPRLLLLDDIDRGLHVEAQAELVRVLRELLDSDPELQIVCTTHSPYLLDRFEPKEVRVLGLDMERHTRARALTEHPEFEKWQFGSQTGELWAALGTAWVTSDGISREQ